VENFEDFHFFDFEKLHAMKKIFPVAPMRLVQSRSNQMPTIGVRLVDIENSNITKRCTIFGMASARFVYSDLQGNSPYAAVKILENDILQVTIEVGNVVDKAGSTSLSF
jgi:hypothetical protein